MKPVKIKGKIVDYRVDKGDAAGAGRATGKPDRVVDVKPKVVRMHEKLERPEMLEGSTYKLIN